MPFRDREWEDFQRDCDFFPAYADYIYGVDARPEVADEPGLHPQIYKPPPPPRPRLRGLHQTSYAAAYDPVRDAASASHYTAPGPIQQPYQDYRVSPSVTRELLHMLPNPRSTSLLKQESSLETLMPTPTPAPRILPVPDQPMPLLRPGELAADPVYSCISQRDRMIANKNIIQAWSIVNSDAIPAQKARAMHYLKGISNLAVATKQKHMDHEISKLDIEVEARAEPTAGLLEILPQDFQYDDKLASPSTTQLETDRQREAHWEASPLPNTYAISDISQLPAYVHSRLPQLWTCIETVALQGPPADETHQRMHQQAQQYLAAFKRIIPPKGRPWVGLVVNEMLSLRRRGADPLMVLETMPSVESVYEAGPEHFRCA